MTWPAEPSAGADETPDRPAVSMLELMWDFRSSTHSGIPVNTHAEVKRTGKTDSYELPEFSDAAKLANPMVGQQLTVFDRALKSLVPKQVLQYYCAKTGTLRFYGWRQPAKGLIWRPKLVCKQLVHENLIAFSAITIDTTFKCHFKLKCADSPICDIGKVAEVSAAVLLADRVESNKREREMKAIVQAAVGTAKLDRFFRKAS